MRRYRVIAALIAAAIAGLAGATFASWQGAVFPQNFTMSETISLYCMMILGGTRSIPGIMLGVLLLHALPEVLREFSVYRMLIYGFVLVLLAIFRPQGLFPQGEPLISPRALAAAGKERNRREAEEAPAVAGVAVPAAACRAAAPAAAPAPASTPALELSGLTCSFGGVVAASDVSLTVGRGEILGIIGPNGAGKTTLFNLITGLVPPDSGEVEAVGQARRRPAATRHRRAGRGPHVPEHTPLRHPERAGERPGRLPHAPRRPGGPCPPRPAHNLPRTGRPRERAGAQPFLPR